MRVQSNYGDTVFDTRVSVLDAQNKIRKLVVYLILTAFSIYVGKVVLNLNLAILQDLFHKIINGESIDLDQNYIMNSLQSNEVVAYLFSVYYFLEKCFVLIKDYIFLFGDKALNTVKNLLSLIK